MALSQNSLNNGARWEVRWQGKHGNIVRKAFEEDFGGALETYTKLSAAGKKLVTLRCCNVGFPPPARITAHEVTDWEIVRRRGKRYKRKVVRYVNLMSKLNDRGVWWCPYCVKLRRFEQTADAHGRPLMLCPVCDISNYDFHVRRHNPKAQIIEYRRRTRGSRKR